MKQETNSIPAISVIVPIYNMEKLMRKCLDSILAQTFQDYECLLIDDGSKDGSPAICDEYAAMDPRFTAYHKPNGGLSDARNYGIERAQGDYTIFFDPDDWVDADCLMDMYAKAQETDADMVICDYFNEDPYQRKYGKQEPTSLNHNDVLKDIIVGELFGFTWNKLLKRDLYSRFDLQYPFGMYGCEDQYTMCKILKNNIKIAYLPKAYYHYMHFGNDSLSRHFDKGTYQLYVKARDMFFELLKDTDYGDLVYAVKTHHVVGCVFFYGYKNYTSKEFVREFSQYQWFVKIVPLGKLEKIMYELSFKGFFRETRYLFGRLYQMKQLLKKIIYKFEIVKR